MGIYNSLCPYGRLQPPKPPWVSLYSSIPEPRRSVVVVRVPRTLSTIEYDCYRNIPRFAPIRGLHPLNPPGLGLYPSIRKPRRRVVVLTEPRTCEMLTIMSNLWKAYNGNERMEGYNYKIT